MSRAERQPSTRATFNPGDVIGGRYRVNRVLGEGACGVVYVADDATESKPAVALKVIHRHLLKNRQIHRRFIREAGILRKLECENIVSLLDFGEHDDGLLFMAIELVEGQALDQLLEDGPIDIPRAVAIVKQICRALDVAHAAGIVHRDLKPGNVLLDGAGEEEDRARVLDFGMAKVLRGDIDDSITALTEQNMVFGTPEYMAPEQARGDDVDARSDIYAAGIILYELVTGTVPFKTNTPIATMTAHLTDDPPTPSSRAPTAGIPPALESVILHALKKAPTERYPSATILSAALESALEHPTDIQATIPPKKNDIALQDTETDLSPHLPATRIRQQPHPSVGVPADRVWVIAAVVAALLGIGAGVLFSLAGG